MKIKTIISISLIVLGLIITILGFTSIFGQYTIYLTLAGYPFILLGLILLLSLVGALIIFAGIILSHLVGRLMPSAIMIVNPIAAGLLLIGVIYTIAEVIIKVRKHPNSEE